MMRTALTSAALFAAAQAIGDAIVVNKCSYDVYMSNTPAMGGGYSNIDKTLSSGATYSQTYTELSNGNGWSIKLSKEENAFQTNILQYEYTFHNDGTIWYDLSAVDGNPWDANWEITASKGCSPRQAAYRYATDDAYGMQSCGDDATITVTLCSGEAGAGSGSGGSPSSAPAPTSEAPAPSSPVETSTKKQNGGNNWGHHTWGLEENKVAAAAGDALLDEPKSKAPAQSPTTLATVHKSFDGPAVTVTNVHMETLTKFVTATDAPSKRHEHHRRHEHRQ
ncbi:uncharacterized protein LTR77_000330 [Saxophila tyrrhenica]|uniref:Uncharacterized protein n=1 Tax=Saxophila tyrrhenica TaxID=1690608 RepID=A0AAV9PS81_9PEZI|nr:hypothetical protein LTR77_000330 [Saxophila tyrrhenica]